MTYGLLDRPLNVTGGEALNELSSLLHDETCSVDDMVHDPVARTLVLPVRRQFHGGDEIVVNTQLGFTTYEKSWMRSELLIRHVRGWDKEDDQGIGDYSFNDWEWAGNTVKIFFCEALILTVVVDKLEITMTDLGFNGRARIRRYLGGSESSSGQVY
jgi:hypothetical protein